MAAALAHRDGREIHHQLLAADGCKINVYEPGQPFQVSITVETDGTRGLSCDLLLTDQNKSKVALGSLAQFEGQFLPTRPGTYTVVFSFAPIYLASGQYTIDATTAIVNHNWDHYVSDAVAFEVLYSNPGGHSFNFAQSLGYGPIALPVTVPTAIQPIERRRENAA